MSTVEQPRLRPKYEIEKLEGTVKRTRYKRVRKPLLDEDGDQMVDDQGRKMWERSSVEPYQVEEPAGFMVYFLAGHSIRVRDHAELVRLGLAGPAPLVDEDGVETEPEQPVSLKAQVKANTRGRRSHRAAGG